MRRRLGAISVVALFAATVLVSPARAVTAPDLYGLWVVTTDTASDYALRPSPDLRSLHVFWNGTQTHSALRGTFDGTVNATGNAYNGTFHVTEGSVAVDGTGVFALSKIKEFGLPLVHVHLVPNSGGGVSNFTLEVLFRQPHAVPGGSVTIDESCPGPSPCNGAAAAEGSGSAISPDVARVAKATILGSVKFKIKPGHSKKLTIHLNKAGRKLLSKRGALKLRIVITLTRGSGRRVTNVGTVTVHR
jgi:hypothetical protein